MKHCDITVRVFYRMFMRMIITEAIIEQGGITWGD